MSIADSAANVQTNLDTLAGITASMTITLTDVSTPTITVTGTQFTDDAAVLGDISSSYHLAVTGVLAANASTVAENSHVTSIAVSDSAADVQSNLAALETIASGSITLSIALTDISTPTITLSATQLSNDTAVLGDISSSYNLAVTGVLAANASTVAENSHVTSIAVSDSAAFIGLALHLRGIIRKAEVPVGPANWRPRQESNLQPAA